MINRYIKLVINRYTNPKQKVKTKILQKLLIYPITFLIYIKRVFFQIEEKLPKVIYMSFVDNLEFLIYDCSNSKVARLLKKTKKVSLKWRASNSVIYIMCKTKIILFLKVCH